MLLLDKDNMLNQIHTYFLYLLKTSKTTSLVVAKSSELNFDLKNGTFTPKFFEYEAISLLSVETIISSNILDFIAAFIDQKIIGFLLNILIFFFYFLLPFLAGMIQIIFFIYFFWLSIILKFNGSP